MKKLTTSLAVLLLFSATTGWVMPLHGKNVEKAASHPASLASHSATVRLTRRNATGNIAVRGGGRHLPENAEVSFVRTHAKDKKDRLRNGFGRHHGRKGRRGAVNAQPSTLNPQPSTHNAQPSVLAMYDISINADGKKWQPAEGEPVRVDVELAEPVQVKDATGLGVAHLADDGTVEELEASRYGFTYNAERTAVTAFWFSATGFSVYAIVDSETGAVTGRRLYDFYSLDFDTSSPTFNKYVPRYFTTVDGNKTFRQIVKSGEYLSDPEVLPSPYGRTFIGWFLYDPNKANTTVDGVTYDADGYATTMFNFDEPVTFTSAGTAENSYAEEIVLRARFAHEAYVVFHEQKVGNEWPITGIRRSALAYNSSSGKWEASVQIDDVTVTYDDQEEENENETEHVNEMPRMIFRGWSRIPVEAGELTNIEGGEVVREESPFIVKLDNLVSDHGDTPAEFTPIDLYPVFVNINWLTYKAAEAGQGATYIPPKFYYQDESVESFPVPERTGYTFVGWYTSTNKATGVKIADASGNLVANAAAVNGWGTISGGKLKLTDDVTLYGRWEPGLAKYTVVVLRQSLNDDRDAIEKTYDFACSMTNMVETESSVSVADNFKKLETSVASSLALSPSQTTADFEGFYYSHCDEGKTVKGDGSTVLRVYYDRYRFSYVFRKSGTTGYFYAPSTVSPYIYTDSDLDYYSYTATALDYYTYTSTTADYYTYTSTPVERYTYEEKYSSGSSGRTRYTNGFEVNLDYWGSGGKVNGSSVGGYTKVYPVLNGNYYYWSTDSGSYADKNRYKNGTIYSRTVNDVTQYGVSNGNYFELEYSDANNRWQNSSTGAAYTGTRYTRAVNNNLGTLYGTEDGKSYFEIAYSVANNRWQNGSGDAYTGTRYTRSQTANLGTLYGSDKNGYFELRYANGEWQNSATGEAYTGTRYTRTQNYTGDVYGTENGASPYDVTPFVVSYEDGNWITNGAPYKGTRYTRELNSELADHYGTNNGASPYSSTPFRIYFRNGEWRTSDSDSGTIYTGTRYVRIASSGSNYAPSSDVDDPGMTGLYGQSLSMYGYDWPTDYKWKIEGSSNVNMTYLETFNYTEYGTVDSSAHTRIVTFTQDGNQGSSVIYHVLQGLDGTYSEENAIRNLCAGGNFSFTDKFEGFSVYGFTEGTGSFTANPSHNASVGGSSNNKYPLYVYHQRSKYTVTLCDSYNLTPYRTVEIYYGAPLASVTNGLVATPTEQTMQEGNSFSGWYSDQSTSTRFNFDRTMPRNNLIAYAGWSTDWYLIQIDPNMGQLAEGQSTWFWKTYGFKDIQEYTTTTRSFVESVDVEKAKYFYAVQDRNRYELTEVWEEREDDISQRGAYYTKDQSDEAIVDPHKRYAPAQNAYRYAGWYEVKPDGSEELYAFGQPVTHNLLLRLHWKHIGTYHLLYMAGEGRMSHEDENETTFNMLEGGAYADNSEVLVMRTAIPPAGYSFSGWKIRYGDNKIYHPGQSFIFNSAYTMTGTDANGNTVKQLVLDAVYDKVSTTRLTTDANGGVVDGSIANTLTLAYDNPPALFTNVTDTARSVFGMRNNAYGTLSDGTGYSCTIKDENGNDVSLEFMGWNTKADGTGRHFDGGALVGLDTLDTQNENGANTLYAEWAVKVYFDKANDMVADWRDADWDTNVFTWVESKQMYCQTTTLNGYATYPNVIFQSSDPDQMFAFWSTNRYTDTELLAPHDFSQPVTAPLTLYARYQHFIQVNFHAVDATYPEIALKDGEWIDPNNNVFRIGNYTDVSFNEAPTNVTTGAGYDYAFTCVSADKDSISESRKIKRLYFNSDREIRAVYVEYADGTTGPLESGMEIYSVYFQNPRPIDISYVVMQDDGSVSSVTSAGLGNASLDTNAWNMADAVTEPLPQNSEYGYYAFAIGDTDATAGSQLHYITEAKRSNDDRPQLALRNTWRGIEYSTDGETWHNYGFEAELYVVYFTSQPTIINLHEQTIGTADDMATEFEYVVTVSNVTTTVNQTRTRTLSTSNTDSSYYSGWSQRSYPYSYKYNNKTYYFGANGIDWSDWGAVVGEPSVVGEKVSTVTNLLANGGTDAVTLFASVVGSGNWANGGTNATTHTESSGWFSNTTYLDLTETQTRSVTTNMQMIVITQVPKDGFTTTNDNGDGAFVYTATSTLAASSSSVTYTNRRDSLPVDLHVAVSQGETVKENDAWQSDDPADRTLNVAIGEDGTFAASNSVLTAMADSILKNNHDGHTFVGIYYGATNENGNVVFSNKVTSVGFVKPAGSDYYELCLNDDPTLRLGDYRLYYVYCEMPKVYYVKEGANGALTQISPMTYTGEAVSMNGAQVEQGKVLDVGDTEPLVVASTGHNVFHVPLGLDGVREASLNLFGFGAGAADVASTNEMDGVTLGDDLQLKVLDGVLKWSVDGASWSAFAGEPAVYVIYKEIGRDLTINANSLASDDDKATDTFTFTIASDNLKDGQEYEVSGYFVNGEPIISVTVENGTITLTNVTSGSSITIMSLPDHDVKYTIVEDPGTDYELSSITFNGHEGISQEQIENGTSTFMARDKVVEFTVTKSYTVQFVDDGGSPIMVDDGNGGETPLTKKVPYGTTPAEFMDGVADPTKSMDSNYIYRFENWGPAVETVGSNTTYTAEYRMIKIPEVVQRAADTNLVVSLSAEEALAREEALLQALKDVGIDLEDSDYSERDATEELNRVDPNGLRHWENLVTGTSTNHLLLSTVTMTNSTESTISLVQDEDPQAPIARALGYEVLYDLKRLYNVQDVANREWRRVDGPGEKPSFTVQLIDEDGNSLGAAGYYRVYTLIIPMQDLSITNEIPSTNIIGVLEVNSPLKNTMTAVPWKALATAPEEAQPVAVQNYVDIGQLENGDVINALDEEGTYQQWTLENGEWKKAAATVREVKGMMKTVSTPKAADRTLERGDATWVSRNGTEKPYFLVGQYTGENVEITIVGGEKAVKDSTMVTNPTLYPLNINDIDWGGNPSADDVIQVPNGLGVPQELIWKNNSWGYSAKVYDAQKKRYVKEWKTDFTIPSGTGFWYYRTGGSFKITIDVDQID